MCADTGWPFGGYAGIGDEAAADVAGQVGAVTALGWTAIELRTVGGTPLAALHPRRFAEVADAVTAAGLRVVCVDSRIGNWSRPATGPMSSETDELAVLARQCATLDCRLVRIMSWPNDGLSDADWRRMVLDRAKRLADLAEQAGLTLVHENCAGWASTSADRALELLAAVGSPALRLLFDVGNGIEYRYRALDLLRDLVPYVAHVHVKDAVRTPAGVRYTLPGEGDCEVADCLRMLAAHGYRGALSIEPHLATRPHEHRFTGSENGFRAAGRRLVSMVADEVVPARVPPAAPAVP
jgi:sugar phosphate isomerase/epimerase